LSTRPVADIEHFVDLHRDIQICQVILFNSATFSFPAS
jgi:hypothetical protein